MKEVLAKSILPIFFTAILTFLFNCVAVYFSQPAGRFSTTEMVSSNSVDYLNLSITNYSDKSISDLQFLIANPEVAIISSNKTLTTTDVGQAKKLNVGIISPKEQVTIQLSGKKIDYGIVKPVNFDDKGIKKINDADEFFKYVGVNTLFFIIVYIMLILFLERLRISAEKTLKNSVEERNSLVQSLEARLKQLEEQSDEIEKEYSENRKATSEYRLYLQSRIDFLVQELNFWNNLIKEIVKSKYEGKSMDHNELISELKTIAGVPIDSEKLNSNVSIAFYEKELDKKIKT